MAVDQQYITRPSLAPPAPPEPIWRLSVEQYHEMINAGILDEDDPVELLEGWLIPKTPKNPPHSFTTDLTREALARMLPSGWHVSEQEPITTEDSEPEPDVTVIRGERRDYTEPSGEAEEPDYQRRQDYFPDDEMPILVEGREVGRLTARELLP